MPSAAALTVVDNAAVNHTFAPVKASPELTVYVDRVGNTSAGDGIATCGITFASATRETNKVKQSLVMPIEALQTDGTYKVVKKPRCNVEWTLPDMTTAERLKFDTMVESFLTNATMRGLRRSLDPVY